VEFRLSQIERVGRLLETIENERTTVA